MMMMVLMLVLVLSVMTAQTEQWWGWRGSRRLSRIRFPLCLCLSSNSEIINGLLGDWLFFLMKLYNNFFFFPPTSSSCMTVSVIFSTWKDKVMGIRVETSKAKLLKTKKKKKSQEESQTSSSLHWSLEFQAWVSDLTFSVSMLVLILHFPFSSLQWRWYSTRRTEQDDDNRTIKEEAVRFRPEIKAQSSGSTLSISCPIIIIIMSWEETTSSLLDVKERQEKTSCI